MWPASAFHPTHTVYSGTSLSEHCPDTAGTAFDACKGFLPGQSWSFKFTKAGTWKYHDHLNPGATGTIVVE
jgi:plastocyanin